MSEIEFKIWTIGLAAATLLMTIIAAGISTYLARRTAKYTVIHYINTQMVEMIKSMYEINAIVGSNREKTEELRAKVYEDTIKMNDAAMALSLEYKSQKFLSKKQVTEIDTILKLKSNYYLCKTDAERIKCIDQIYMATCRFNEYSKKEILDIEDFLRKTGGYNG